MSKFLHAAAANNDDDTKAIAIPRVFSENSRAKNKQIKNIIYRTVQLKCLLSQEGTLYREYVYSVAMYQQYLTRLGELIIFEP